MPTSVLIYNDPNEPVQAGFDVPPRVGEQLQFHVALKGDQFLTVEASWRDKRADGSYGYAIRIG